MFSFCKGIVPQRVDQYNQLIDDNLCPIHDHYSHSVDEEVVLSGECLKTYKDLNDLNVCKDIQTVETLTTGEDNDHNPEVETNDDLRVCQTEDPDQKDVIINDSEEDIKKSHSNVCQINEYKDRHKLVAIKVNPILERLMTFRKHSFVTKTIVPKEICNICGQSIKFSEKYIQCFDCISISHIQCSPQLPVPCIRYTDPNLRPTKVISNYVYPAFRPSVPALLIHCVREVEERCHEISPNTLYVMNSELLKPVKDLFNCLLESKNGFHLLKNFNINIICGVIKKFFNHFNESLVGREIWKQFSYNMKKKSDEELDSMLKQMIRELNVTNRDTLSFLIIHLKHLADNQKCIHLDVLIDIFCPIICGETEVKRKLKLMSSLIQIDYKFWTNIINK